MTDPTTPPESPMASAERLLAEALEAAWAAQPFVPVLPTHQHIRTRQRPTASALLAHPALADTLLRGLGAEVESEQDRRAGESLRLLNAALGERQWIETRGPDSGPGEWDPASNGWMVRVVGFDRNICRADRPTLAEAADDCRAILQPPARPGPTDGPSQRGEGL